MWDSNINVSNSNTMVRKGPYILTELRIKLTHVMRIAKYQMSRLNTLSTLDKILQKKKYKTNG